MCANQGGEQYDFGNLFIAVTVGFHRELPSTHN